MNLKFQVAGIWFDTIYWREGQTQMANEQAFSIRSAIESFQEYVSKMSEQEFENMTWHTFSFEPKSPKINNWGGSKVSIRQWLFWLGYFLKNRRKDGPPTFADSHIKCSHKRLREKGGKDKIQDRTKYGKWESLM